MLVSDPQAKTPESPSAQNRSGLARVLFPAITLLCFAYLYQRLNGAAERDGMTLLDYMTDVFATVSWGAWAALMVSYSIFYFLIDTLVVSRALKWFVTDIRYRDILPVRASAYIISLLNEQIGKGAMAWYLHKRHQVPGWEVGSVMLFIMFCEVFYLLAWASIGYLFSGDALPPVFALLPWISVGGAVVLVLWIAYFRGWLLPNNKLRDKAILHAFRSARPIHYAAFFLLRSPALLAAVFVYTVALGLFGVQVTLLGLLPLLPIIFFAAAVPTPMRAAAITFWVVLFPENEGQMAAFGFVQHNFFILFNAAIGLLFWRRAQKDLFA